MRLSRVKYYPAGNRQYETPLFFIHGAWHDKWCWEENFVPFFSKNGFDVYAITLPGHDGNKNDRKINLQTIGTYVKALEEELAELTETPVLLGHSMGGYILQKYLEKYPAKGYVLLASAPPSGIFAAVTRFFRKYPLAFLQSVFSLNLYHLVADREKSVNMFFSRTTKATLLEKYTSSLGNESLLAFVGMMFPGNIRINYHTEVPGLAIAAENDNVINLQEQQEIAGFYRIALKTIEKSSHDIMLDPEWEKAAGMILDWMKKEIRNL